MVVYIEEYKIRWTSYGIEDHMDGAPPEDHFQGRDFKEGTAKRYVCWKNGVSVGGFDTLPEARHHITCHVIRDAMDDKEKAIKTLAETQHILDKIKGKDRILIYQIKR